MKSFRGYFVVTLTMFSIIIWLGNHIEFSIGQKTIIYFLTILEKLKFDETQAR